MQLKHPDSDEIDTAYLKASLRLMHDHTVQVTANDSGHFSIDARLTDTLFFSGAHMIKQKYAVSDLLKRKQIAIYLKNEPCEQYLPCTDKLPNKLYAFIAEKISVERLKQPYYCDGHYSMSIGLLCKYRVIKSMYGDYNRDSVTFELYYHEGGPSFTQFKNVLVVVSEYCGKLYFERHQFYDLYQTTDGRWASPGDPYKFDGRMKDKPVHAIPLKFDQNLSFDTRWKFLFPEVKYEAPYFRIENGRAYPLLGTYVEDLFQIKRNGVLKARGIFPENEK